MPIYEYECQKCGKVFETIRKFSDPRLTECLCEEKGPVTKLISAAAFHLKGGGWYVTDFRDQGKGKDKDRKGDGDGSSGDSGSKPDDGKAAARDGAESGSSAKKEGASKSKSDPGAAKNAAD